jgi:predicted nucleotidyltransferase
VTDPTLLVASLRDALLPRDEILEAYLFGSRARGTARTNSDVDVAVHIDDARAPSPPWGYDADLAAALMSELRTSRVDVVVLHRAPPLLYHRVLRDGIRLFARDLRATTVREGRALSRYCDDLPRLAVLDRALGERVHRGGFGGF